MASEWQEAAVEQAEEISARLKQLLITGLGLVHTELGLDLGLQPQLYPSWVFLAVPASLGLLLLLLLCTAGRGKKQVRVERETAVVETKSPAPSKSIKVEDSKKKNKKKLPEKAKPNGRPVELADEEIIPVVKNENQKQPLDTDKKNEKAKKNKKKPKVETKPTLPNKDKKEVEEGNWETKISNKEKRQQRKRDKGEPDINSPFVEPTNSFISERIISIPSNSSGPRKPKVSSSSEISAVNGSGWNEKSSKLLSSQLGEEKWVPVGKKKSEPWNRDAGDTNGKDWSAPWSERPIFPNIATWSSVDGGISATEPGPTSFSTIGLNSTLSAAVSETVSKPNASDSQWEATPTEPCVDDVWSGSNGIASADLGSDWNAPAEEWGNWGEEEPEPAPQPDEPEDEVQKVSDDEKEKEEVSAQGATSKNKKKKKKKKKQNEESDSAVQDTEIMDKEPRIEFKDVPQARPQPVRIISALAEKPSEPKEVRE
ncbi:protein LYRIC [Bombina bombina]|uniref:protein LYRIC n=1 Tax=Bombina bombina TaxID=8345 RepID=UPI00235B1645|nr:protein LYRIC [Bombina bombina]